MLGKEEFLCSVCLHYLHEPVAVAACSHVFCRSCIDRCSVCPLCRSPIFSLVEAYWTCEQMQQITDSCGYCRFSGSLLAVGAHQKVSCRMIHSTTAPPAPTSTPSERRVSSKKKRSVLRDKKKKTAAVVMQRRSETGQPSSLSQVYTFGRSLQRAVIEVEESVIDLEE